MCYDWRRITDEAFMKKKPIIAVIIILSIIVVLSIIALISNPELQDSAQRGMEDGMQRGTDNGATQ